MQREAPDAGRGLGTATLQSGTWSRFNFALLTLVKEVGLFTFRVLGDKQPGWWGNPTLGHGTSLQPLSPGFLESKDVVVCGYPGDKCGAQPYDATRKCSPLRLHAADTHKGQSGSPVWIRFRDDPRRLVRVHTAPHRVRDANTGRMQVVRHNRSVHLSADVAALIQGWIR